MHHRSPAFASILPAILALTFGAAACGGDDGPPSTTDGGRPPTDGSTSDTGTASDSGGGNADADTPGDAGGDDGGSAACGLVGLPPGDDIIELMFDGRTRRYYVHVPPSYDGSVAVPLVLDFHGFTSDPPQQIALSEMNPKSDAEGFVAVYPEGWGGAKSWNGGLCCGDAASMDLDDVGLVRAIIDDVASRVCIDRRRVYSTGMSNGGFLSHRLACEASDVIAAIAPVAGVIGVPMESCTPGRAVPVIHFHGTSDLLVPYNGGSFGFPGVEETMMGWATRNGCDPTSMETYSMGDTTCQTWSGCDEGVLVTLCTSRGEGHWWPGGPGSGADIDATDTMWEFMSAYSLP